MLLAARSAGVASVVAVPAHTGPNEVTSRTLMDRLAAGGVQVLVMPAMSWPREVSYRWGLSPAQILWTARHVSDFDVIHVHGIWGMAPLGGLLAGRIAGTPIVVTAHESLTNFDINGSRSAARRRQKLLLKAVYLRHTTLFLLTSELEARASLAPKIRQRIVPYPLVDDRGSVPQLRPRGRGAGLRVGFLARIDPKKNLDLLIDAMQPLGDHVRLIVAGSGPTELVESLRARATRLGVGDRVEWLGFVDPTDRPGLLADLDVLAMPSAFESFGLSAGEAMLHGVPVLVTEQTGIAELVRRHGAGRITPADASSIAAAIGELDNERGALRELGARGQAAVLQELSFMRVGQALYEAYEDAVRGSPRPNGAAAQV